MGGLWGDRSGREPVRARSPLRLRLAMAASGGLLCALAFVAVVVLGRFTWPALVLLAAAVVGVVDSVVVARRLRAGEQPH